METLPNASFKVQLESGAEILAHVSGKMRMRYIRILPGDVVEMEVSATMTGEMEMPDGSKVPPTGKIHTMKGCLIVETENGKQKNQRMYADMMSMMQGFGIMPG